jgi:hypothetical protein
MDPSKVRPPTDSKEIYKGVAAPKRKKVEEEPTVDEIPKVPPCPPASLPVCLPPPQPAGQVCLRAHHLPVSRLTCVVAGA